ncbi:dTDP-4-amino-4,6-dideoxy-D-galactose acyltransferase [Dysgonomonas sp. PFB1-18]|uniref:GNAT family N-acetyltransferase n=1 Tax=unclassified Dysgonomonas TaxID=2630389 RepID=UPI0024763ACF|nr:MULTISPECIES: GNAT family N-acetyltransferase [unclassified Dysgonomonas]MDH6308488.1 dTDP-4-amino-4,6-dideoxy-D-galactose acyltransferase [Dysgonomonas sp. PF1-14]MDH6337989.1 dTDP-4-amino-4,6-dideoxy-D-galactose acyltransferase [Dysgonomonas sp. PF1-16]MDH6379486.1 dTDP-4-amino-4,6-dideoxy-D-galactose acyltransferase [Dysgonomonas sp. PFB1-18]MDH6396817.1 dTDP-4-amino-4,6-dideoxy-D-galactose acyltransferase [Dysgonomonas sp. PF1-23]
MIEYLQWDSDFFEKKIGRIYCSSNMPKSELAELLRCAKEQNYELLYCFGDEHFFVETELLNIYDGSLVDRKVIFTMHIEGMPDDDLADIHVFEETALKNEMLELAYLSGGYSRYKTDHHFTDKDFRHFYKTWMQNSINGAIADKVFVAYRDSLIAGMVTVKKSAMAGTIGLIATNANMHGNGYGRRLVNKVKRYLYEDGIMELDVATQLDNEPACRFYNKCGFKVKSINNIYHFWL